jgi:phospholipid-binding lipoprotein MlaA
MIQLHTAFSIYPTVGPCAVIAYWKRRILRWMFKALKVGLVVLGAAVMSGCATVSNPDPLEAVNRKMFMVNEGLDKVVLKPAAKAYQAVVPAVAQTGISNFFSNLAEPWTSANLLMQGEVKASAQTLGRFGANTTVGVFGLMDPASGWGLPKRREDFGLTLDAWGIGTGTYLVVPLMGSTNVRDLLASPVNGAGDLTGGISSTSTRNMLAVTKMVSKRSQYLRPGELLEEAALDKYSMMRDIHLKRRNRSESKKPVTSSLEPSTTVVAESESR